VTQDFKDAVMSPWFEAPAVAASVLPLAGGALAQGYPTPSEYTENLRRNLQKYEKAVKISGAKVE